LCLAAIALALEIIDPVQQLLANALTHMRHATGTLSSILVELHKMIGMLHAPDSYFFSQHALVI
jgi:hypothetical protein